MANLTILEALDKFNEESGRINDDIIKNLVSNAELPPVIYHYTDDFGIRGILKTGKFWLTDIFALNDPSELEHGVSHFIKALDDKIANGHPEGESIAEYFKIFMRKKNCLLLFLFVRSARTVMILDNGVHMQTMVVASLLGLIQKCSKMRS